MTDKKPYLAICMPTARGFKQATNRSLQALLAQLRTRGIGAAICDPEGYQIDKARNMITEVAVNRPEVTHLMWIDDDMTFEPDAVSRLLDHDLPIVGGLCHNRRHPYMPILVHLDGGRFSFQYDYPEGLVEVDATGGAFLLMKKEVITKIHERYPEGPWSIIDVGEDVSFCKRATSVGYKILVDTTVKIGHLAEVVVDEEFAQRNRNFRANPWYPAKRMPEGPPRASIVIPTYNQRPEFFRAAVESALNQTVPVEVIVIDNGSDPIVKPFLPNHPAIRHFRIDKNPGHPWDALNLGIDEMRTEWFTWLSSDDLFYPPKIERQLSLSVHASFHAYDRIGNTSNMVVLPAHWKTIGEQQSALSKACLINGLTVMIHRRVFESIGKFDPSLTVSADWEMWNRIGQSYLWLGVDDVLATRREFEGNASQRYARDPKMAALWKENDDRVREMYSDSENGEENAG